MPTAIATEDSSNSNTSKLQQLLSFLKSEVEAEERISMTKSGFKSSVTSNYSNKHKKEEECSQPTACNLFASEHTQSNNKRPLIDIVCIFCDKLSHEIKECFVAQKFSLAQKKDVFNRKDFCFVCIKQGHRAKTC